MNKDIKPFNFRVGILFVSCSTTCFFAEKIHLELQLRKTEKIKKKFTLYICVML